MTQATKLANAKTAHEFIFAGKATFTLRSLRTGQHYTYRLTTVPDAQPPRYFVGLLTGPDNTSDFTYIGMAFVCGFRLTSASKMTHASPPVLALGYALRGLEKGHLASDLEIFHEGRCAACGRALTVPESIASGFGPECGRMQRAERMLADLLT